MQSGVFVFVFLLLGNAYQLSVMLIKACRHLRCSVVVLLQASGIVKEKRSVPFLNSSWNYSLLKDTCAVVLSLYLYSCFREETLNKIPVISIMDLMSRK